MNSYISKRIDRKSEIGYIWVENTLFTRMENVRWVWLVLTNPWTGYRLNKVKNRTSYRFIWDALFSTVKNRQKRGIKWRNLRWDTSVLQLSLCFRTFHARSLSAWTPRVKRGRLTITYPPQASLLEAFFIWPFSNMSFFTSDWMSKRPRKANESTHDR